MAAVIECHKRIDNGFHAVGTLNKLLAEGKIGASWKHHTIIVEVQLYASTRDAEEDARRREREAKESPVQPPLMPDDPPAPAVHHSNYQDAPHAKSTRSNPRMLREDD